MREFINPFDEFNTKSNNRKNKIQTNAQSIERELNGSNCPSCTFRREESYRKSIVKRDRKTLVSAAIGAIIIGSIIGISFGYISFYWDSI